MKTLCVYYSRSGKTQKIAQNIAANLGAESIRISDKKAITDFSDT